MSAMPPSKPTSTTSRPRSKASRSKPAFAGAVAPGTMEHWMKDEYDATDEAYLFAIADAMHEECHPRRVVLSYRLIIWISPTHGRCILR